MDDPSVVLIGIKTREGWETLNRLGIRFMLLTDEVDGAVELVPGATSVHAVPFKADPLSVLRAPVPTSVTAVLSFTELGLLPAALLGEALGVPTVSVAAVLRTRNKLMMRRALSGHVAQPAFGVVGIHEPAGANFPIVVKPVDGSGSRNVEFIVSLPEYAQRSVTLRGYLWERYIDGAEYSVEAVSANGTHHVLGITEKMTTGQPHFIETGHIVPAIVSASVGEEIRRCTRTCLRVLGITVGASHTEVKVNDGKVVVIETHTRGGGDRIPLLTKLVTGYDQFKMAVESVIAPAVQWTPSCERHAVASVRYFPWQDVTLRAVTGLDECARSAGIVEVELQVEPGHYIPPWRYSHERPGYLVACADSRAELIRRMDFAQQFVEADLVNGRKIA